MENQFKRFLSLLVAVVMVLSLLPATAFATTEDTNETIRENTVVAQTGDDATEVANIDDLNAALAADAKSIVLTADITVDTAITVADGTVIDLNGKTLYINVENSYYNDVTIKNGSIVLGKDDVHVCDGYFLVKDGKTLVLNGVNVSSSSEGIKGYAVFHLKTGANLDLVSSSLNIADNEYSAGYVVYAGESTATVDITNTTLVAKNTNGIVHAATVIEASEITIEAVEHGINRSGVTISDSNVTISGGTGRGITAQHGDLVITGNSVVNISNMGEATIELRSDKNLSVAETAKVTVDVAVNNTTNGTVIGNVAVGAAGLSGEGTEASPYLISSLEELKWFRDDVNAGNTYSGQYVKLTADIDLNNEDWTPIGNKTNVFRGSFDGGSCTVSNLYINDVLDYYNGGESYVGLFGYIKNGGYIKNLNIVNADVTGCLYVGAVVGRVYIGGVIENCHVSGNIDIEGYWYVGGIAGRYEYATGIYNCSVKGTADNVGTIEADVDAQTNQDEDGSYVGGIVGFTTEPNPVVTIGGNAVEHVNISGVTRVGGISGIAHYGNVFENNAVSNVNIYAIQSEGYDDEDANTIGLIAGACQGTEENPVTFTNCTASNTTAYLNGEVIAVGEYGENIDGTTPVTNYKAAIGTKNYETLAAAIDAAQKGSTITLLDNITLTEGVSIMDPDVLSDITLDGNGKTITLDMNGTGTGIRFGGEWATGVKIHDLTVEGSANYAIWLNGGTSSALTNVTVKGEYNDVYGALILYGTHGATLTNCDIVSGFVNGQDDYPLTLVNSKIGSLTANVSEAEDGAKVFLDADSSIESLLCGGDSTVMIDYASLERVGSYTTEEGDVVAQVGDVKYATLRAAVDAAADGQTVELLTDITMTGTIEVAKDITIDLGGHTITNNGGSGNHTFRIAADVIVKNGTIDNTAGGYCMIVGYNTPVAGNLTVESGTYYGSTTAISVTYGTATVLGGYFRVYTGGTEDYTYTFNCVDRFYDAGNAAITVKGGTFYSFDPMNNGAEGEGTSFVAEGYAALPDLNGNYVVGTEPTAEVNDLGEMTISAGDYYIYDGSLTTGTEDMPLNFVMQFVANEDAEDMLTSPFADWYADFVITFEGIEGGSFDPTGCYLAGYYGSTESWDGLWVKIPVGGLLSSIEEGTRYPVMTGVGMPQTYDYICSGVQAFSCAMYIPEQILAANPNLKVKLELNVVDSSDAELALKALQTGDKIYNVSETSYTAEDFLSGEAAVVSKETGKLTAYPTLNAALAAAKAGDTVKLLADVTLDAVLVIDRSITLDGNGKTLTSTADRAINVTGADGVTIKDLTINASGERAINIIQNATNVTIENVTATAANYTVNVAASAPGAVVAIKESTLNGLCTVNVAAVNANVTVDDSTVNCNDNNTTAGESYAALCLNKDAIGGKIIATNCTVNVTEGSDSTKGRNGAENGEVTINGSTEGVATTVAVITYPGSNNYHGFATVQAAIDFAKEGDTITLLADCKLEDMIASVPAGVTLDLNGHTLEVNNIWAFGQIVDGTVGGEGGLVVGGNAILDENNTFLPLYDTALGGYRFFSYGLRARGVKTSGSGETLMFTYGFAVDFDNADAYLLMKDAANSGLKLKVDLKWTDIPANKAVTYTITDATVTDFAENAYEDVAVKGMALTTYVMAVRVTGLSSFSAGTEVTATMNIHTAMKVISDGAPLVGTIGG